MPHRAAALLVSRLEDVLQTLFVVALILPMYLVTLWEERHPPA